MLPLVSLFAFHSLVCCLLFAVGLSQTTLLITGSLLFAIRQTTFETGVRLSIAVAFRSKSTARLLHYSSHYLSFPRSLALAYNTTQRSQTEH